MKGKLNALVGIGVALLLCGCAQATPAAVTTPTAKPTRTLLPTQVSAATNAPTQAPTAAPTLVAVVEDQCVTCHTDKDRLIQTAKMEEIVEAESEGVG